MKNIRLRSRPVSEDSEDHRDKLALERLMFFSDAVFAIAITLLVLEIRLPAGAVILTDFELLKQLTGLWQPFLAYVISFMVIGTFWISHHRKFRLIVRYDRRLVLLNLLLLMVIAFIPFPSSVLSGFGGRTGTMFYALTLTFASLAMTALWWYAAWHNRLIVSTLSHRQWRREFLTPFITSGLFVISIGIAWVNPGFAMTTWILILVISYFTARSQP
jgi:uncharacterized membrane protein